MNISSSILPKKSAGSIFVVCASESRGLGKIFIAAVATRMKTNSVANIAIPPPSGTVLSANLSLTGWERKPARRAKIFITPVRISDRMKEPANRIIANMVNVSISVAPVIVL